MVTLVSIIIAIKYLLCNTLPEKPPVPPTEVGAIEWEPVVYDFQFDLAPETVHHRSDDPSGSDENA
jgi:hypothetical protein